MSFSRWLNIFLSLSAFLIESLNKQSGPQFDYIETALEPQSQLCMYNRLGLKLFNYIFNNRIKGIGKFGFFVLEHYRNPAVTGCNHP